MSTTTFATPAIDAECPSARERLTWIVELMSRFALEKCDGHDSARLAAAIVAHLKSLASDLAENSQLADTVAHWIDTWEPIMERHLATQRVIAPPAPPENLVSLTALIQRARFA